MPSNPKRLFGPALLTGSAATKYTVPAATRTLLKRIHFFNNDTVDHTVTLSIGTDSAGSREFDAFTVSAGSPYDAWCYTMLETAEIVQAFASVASKVTLILEGDERTAG